MGILSGLENKWHSNLDQILFGEHAIVFLLEINLLVFSTLHFYFHLNDINIRFRSKFSKLVSIWLLLSGTVRSVPMLPLPDRQEGVNGLKSSKDFSAGLAAVWHLELVVFETWSFFLCLTSVEAVLSENGESESITEVLWGQSPYGLSQPLPTLRPRRWVRIEWCNEELHSLRGREMG